MENRIIEISRKKARNRSGKKLHADLNAKGGDPIFFPRKGFYEPPRFPIDIKPERRSFSVDSSALIIIPAAGPDVKLRRHDVPFPAAVAPKTAKPPAKRKSAAKKTQTPRVKAKTAKKNSPKKPRVQNMMRSNRAIEAQPDTPASAVGAVPILPGALAAVIPPDAPRPEVAVTQPAAPLPRAHAVTLYRKNNVINVLGYWLRTRVADISRLFRPQPKRVRATPAVAQVMAENAALRQEIARLRALQNR